MRTIIEDGNLDPGFAAPVSRLLENRDAITAALSRLGATPAEVEKALLREDRAAVAIEGVDPGQRGALTAACRAQGVALHLGAAADGGGLSAMLLGPALLVREAARDLPPELGMCVAPLLDRRRAVDRPLAWRHARGTLSLGRPLVMGIVNVTPDSFSDGGETLSREAAIARGRRHLEEGAAILDVGGESTRPGAAPVPLEEELARVLPVVEALASLEGAVVSIDTRKPEVARAALGAGAAIVNDVEGLGGERMRGVVAEGKAGAAIMHMRGAPATMQRGPTYADVVAEVTTFLGRRALLAQAAGTPREAIAIDPGFGFGKTLGHNLALLSRLPEIASLGYTVLVGISRKSMLGALTGRPAGERVHAGVAAAALAAASGARIVRTHDVRPTVDALALAAAFAGAPPQPPR